MSFAITQNCCKDASCVAACPVNCIHPTPGEPDFGTAAMLYVDARACIDCGACADACPVDAAVPADVLRGPERAYVSINERYFADKPVAPSTGPLFRSWDAPRFDWSLPSDFRGLDVAVVGTGPAGLYAAELLLLHTSSRVTLIDRLPVAGGLVRYGVAPDHPGTKRVAHSFARLYSHPRVRVALGIEVGADVSTTDLAADFDAVIYAVGASEGRRLDVPGEDLPGVITAPDFVGWYNAHPDAPAVRWTGDRAVVVGTGNVALDVARVLTAEPDDLAGTDISDDALAQLRADPVREVVLLGRRGAAHAAWTEPELLALIERPDVEVVADPSTAAEVPLLRDLPARPDATRRIVLRFDATVQQVLGTDSVTGVRLADGVDLPADLLVTSIGYHGRPLPGLPFDPASGTTPNDAGRVAGVPGAYTVGWFKRGSSGGIGDNRVDAQETVRTLLDDAVAGRLPARTGSPKRFARAHPTALDATALQRVLALERAAGAKDGRPAVKFATREALRAAARR